MNRRTKKQINEQIEPDWLNEQTKNGNNKVMNEWTKKQQQISYFVKYKFTCSCL